MSIEPTEEIQEEAEQQEPTEKQKRKKRRNPLLQLQESIDDLAEMAKDSSLKPNNRADLQLRRADAILSLAKLSADKADSDAIAENETLKQQHEQDTTRISELEAECANWKEKANERVIQTVPDSRLPETIALNQQQAELLQNAASAVKESVDEQERLKIACSLVRRMDKRAQPFVSEIADWASVYMTSLESSESLMSALDAIIPGTRMGARGQMAKATLAARGIEWSGPRSTRPQYADIFTELDGI